MAATFQIMLEQIEVLDAPTAAQGLQRRRTDPKGRLNKLDDEVKRRGYKKLAGPDAEIGVRQKFKANRPIRPFGGGTGAPVQNIDYEMTVSALEDPNSDEQVAIATVSIGAGQNTETYDMMLVADPDFEVIQEFMVENDQVVTANSWWSAARHCVINKCGSTCVGALSTCSGNWVLYLGCLLLKCGGCWVKCSTCSSCNCKWWCRWASGCCRR
jgi:hypothetical protein